jgi:Phosphoinositide phospholipase C, Ca2+-dependent
MKSKFTVGLWLVAILLAAVAAEAQTITIYDLVLQKASHNSYARDESLFDQLVFHRVRSLELDIWQSANWKVEHNGTGEAASKCSPLTKCLAMLAAFHRVTPQHEVVTVWLEPTDYQDGPPPNPFPFLALDQLLVASLGRTALFTPQDLLNTTCQPAQTLTLSQLVERCGFPLTDSLKGKFIFVLMDANPPNEQQALIQYLGNDLANAKPASRLVFVGPEAVPNPDPTKNINWNGAAIFFNHNGAIETTNKHYDPQNTPGDNESRGTVRNCCAGVNECSDKSNTDWTTMITARTQHMGTNCINYETSPWAVTHNANGWPFRCVDPQQCAAKVELNDIVGLRVSSGDLDGTADDFGFAYERLKEGAEQWQVDAFVAAAGSHTNEWAKGCLMSRQTLEPDSPYFAVCRPDSLHNLRVQWRAAKGGSTGIYESSVDPASNAPFVRLLATPGPATTCFSGLMGGGETYPDGFSTCLPGEFLFRGLAASSHDDPTAQMLFGAITLTSGATTTSYTNSSFLPSRAYIGSKPKGSSIAFDGPIGPRER